MTPAPMPTPMEVPPAGPAPMSEFARLTGVFFSPSKAFADIAKRPRWWIPIILSAIVSMVYLNAFTNRVGWEQVIRQALDQSAQGQNMTVQQRDQAVRVGAGIYKYVVYLSPVLALVAVFVIAVVMLLVFDTILGADIGLKRLMGVVSYAYLPMMVSSALAMVVLFLKNPEDFDLQNPLMFNAGAFLGSDASAGLKRLLSSFDLFSFWIIALLAIGMVAAAKKKLTFGKALVGVAVPWLVYVGVVTSIAALNGR